MKYYLPTREECQKIIKKTDSFYVAERIVEGQKVEIYDYRLASLSDFVENKAFELRGLTFVEQSDGTWKRHLLMNKFFNINQTDGWMFEDVQDKKISRVQDKLDGSIISFIRFSNGVIKPKSKMSFESDQANLAKEIFLTNYKIRKFVTNCLNLNLIPIFELVGYKNQIVLNYEEPSELRLLQIRREDGSYLKREDFGKFNLEGIRVAEDYDISQLEEASSKYSKEEAIEKIGNRKFNTFQEMVAFLI